MKNLIALFALVSLTFNPVILLAEESTPAIVEDDNADELSHLGIQERGRFLSASLGVMGQPRPSGDSAVIPVFTLGHHRVDEAVAQMFELHFGITDSSHLVEAVYGIAFGPRKGLWHAGLSVGLGYLHTYDAAPGDQIHGLHYRLGPTFSFTLPWWLQPESFRFHAAAGWSGYAVSNGDYTGVNQIGGWFLELGVAFSVY